MALLHPMDMGKDEDWWDGSFVYWLLLWTRRLPEGEVLGPSTTPPFWGRSIWRRPWEYEKPTFFFGGYGA